MSLAYADTATLEPWDERTFTQTWQRFVERWEDRDSRMDIMRRVVIGDWSVVDKADKTLRSRSPNLIHVGLHDTAASAAMVPTVRVSPSFATTGHPNYDKNKERASKMERLGASYLAAAGGQSFFHQNSLFAGAYGMCAIMVTCDEKSPPKFEYRDPVYCYPEGDIGTLGVTDRVVFARDVYVSQLPQVYRDQWAAHCSDKDWDSSHFVNHAVTLVEYNDCDRVTVGLAYNASTIPRHGRSANRGKANWVSLIVEDYPNEAGMCHAIVGQLPSIDGEPRGQYDQVVGVLHTHIRMMAIALEYADQSVYNPLVVVDPIGDIADGPDAIIELGPNGKAFRLPPASASFSFFEEMNNLIEAVHIGSRWPKARTGEMSQSQASSKFAESMVSIQNTVIGSHHEMFQRMMTQAHLVAFKLDKLRLEKAKAAGDLSYAVSGTLRNKQFHLAVDPDDIDLEASVQVEYGLAFGRDVGQISVISLQLVGGKVISMEDAQENFPGITDIARTQARILGEDVEAMLKAKLLMDAQAGAVDPEMLLDMLDDIRDGKTLTHVYRKYIIAPQKAAQEQMLTSGLGGGQLMPGAPPDAGMGGPQPPTAPPPQDILAGILGGGGAPEQVNRLSVPLSDGGFAGSQMMGG